MTKNIIIVLFTISYSIFNIHYSFGASDTAKVKEFSLKQAQDYGMQHSYNNINAQADVEIAKKQVQQTTAIGLPQINATAQYMRYIDIPVMLIPDIFTPAIEGVLLQEKLISASQLTPSSGQLFPLQFGTPDNLTGTITASQLIFDGSYIVGLQAAKTYKELTSKALVKSELEVKESIAQAYYLVLVAEENTHILDSTLATINKTLNDTKQLQENGFAEETDVDQVQLLALDLENKLNMATRQVEIAYNLLKFQMGMGLNEKIKLTDNLGDIVNLALGQNLTNQEFNFHKHIDYELVMTNDYLNQLLLKKDRTAYMPSLNCYFTTSRSAMRSEFDFLTGTEPWYKTTIFGVNLNVPIWSSGLKHYKIQQDKIALDKSKTAINQAEQALNLEVENNKANVKTYTDQYLTEIKNMDLSHKIYLKTLTKYKQGVSTSLELTQVQNQYLTTQGNYFNIILQLLNANSNLNKALGN